MSCYFEHANITVTDLDAVVSFVTTAVPEFVIRGQGEKVYESGPRKWLHLGTDSSYVALVQARPDTKLQEQAIPNPGLNHLGVVVDDADGVQERLRQAGYEESLVVEPHPYRKRVYFNDPNGNEWEFIEYLTDEPSKRNEYE